MCVGGGERELVVKVRLDGASVAGDIELGMFGGRGSHVLKVG